jgi:hypothetical protein
LGFDCPFLSPLILHLLLKLLQLGLEQTNLGRRVIVRECLTRGKQNSADENVFD